MTYMQSGCAPVALQTTRLLREFTKLAERGRGVNYFSVFSGIAASMTWVQAQGGST
jgi:hypothetical protein